MSAQYKHYDGRKNIPIQYTTLESKCKFSCTESCTCKFIDRRSTYDMLQYQQVMSGKINLPIQNNFGRWNKM